MDDSLYILWTVNGYTHHIKTVLDTDSLEGGGVSTLAVHPEFLGILNC